MVVKPSKFTLRLRTAGIPCVIPPIVAHDLLNNTVPNSIKRSMELLRGFDSVELPFEMGAQLCSWSTP